MIRWCWDDCKTSMIRMETRTLSRPDTRTWAINNCKSLPTQLKESNRSLIMPRLSQGQNVYFLVFYDICEHFKFAGNGTYVETSKCNKFIRCLDSIAVRWSSGIHNPIIGTSWVTPRGDNVHWQMKSRRRQPEMKPEQHFSKFSFDEHPTQIIRVQFGGRINRHEWEIERERCYRNFAPGVTVYLRCTSVHNHVETSYEKGT